MRKKIHATTWAVNITLVTSCKTFKLARKECACSCACTISFFFSDLVFCDFELELLKKFCNFVLLRTDLVDLLETLADWTGLGGLEEG